MSFSRFYKNEFVYKQIRSISYRMWHMFHVNSLWKVERIWNTMHLTLPCQF